MTIASTIAAIKALPGMNARYRDREYRVSYTADFMPAASRREDTAYYTDDAGDALGTATRMSERRSGVPQ